MSTPARIDELRKKFDENPRRYFAPLANEYRKAGDLAQAVALCREFLPNQPGHMSGHIVFGQALYELGLLEESREVFGSALMLDPENLIALRHLGDIAKVTGDAAGARRWYERVLDADPRNDDIAAQLATLATGMTPSAPMRAVPEYGIAPPPSVGPTSVPTPAYGLGAPLGAVPTPDASMRAVDFDQVNQRVAASTPLHVGAVDQPSHADHRAAADSVGSAQSDLAHSELAQSAHALGSSATSASTGAPGGFEPLDLDAMDAAAHDDQRQEDAARAEPLGSAQASEPAAQVDARTDGGSVSASPEGERGETRETSESSEVASEDPAATTHAIHDVEAGDTNGDSQDVAELHADTVPYREIDSARAQQSDEAPVSDSVDDDAQPDSFAEVGNAFANVATTSVPASERAEWGDVFASHDAGARDNASEAEQADEQVDEFEDGILAPEWPDASAILASISSPRSRTPISVDITPDAVEAFGREPHDPVAYEASSGARESDDIVDTQRFGEADDAPVAEPDAAPVAEHAVESTSSANAAPEASALDDSAANSGEQQWSNHESVDLPSDDEPSHDQQASEDWNESTLVGSESVAAEPDGAESAEPQSIVAQSTEAESIDVQGDASDEELDVQPAAAPVFVTETMGELLVSQGFLSRAVEVYDELVRRRPYDPVLTSRLAELRERLVDESIAPDSAPAEASASDAVLSADAIAEQAPADAWESDAAIDAGEAHSEPWAYEHSETPRTAFADARAHTDGDAQSDSPVEAQAHAHVDAAGADGGDVQDEVRAEAGAGAQSSGTFIPAEITSRELFARLAARRVQRHAVASTPQPVYHGHSQPGLDSLFDSAISSNDDAAARALADAFAPISDEEMTSGTALGLDFSTPAERSRAVPSWIGVSHDAVNARSGHRDPISRSSDAPTKEATPPASSGFSFDRFFPDPAAPATPASTDANASTASGTAKPAPATDDLAQFSAWLKGLGNS